MKGILKRMLAPYCCRNAECGNMTKQDEPGVCPDCGREFEVSDRPAQLWREITAVPDPEVWEGPQAAIRLWREVLGYALFGIRPED
jgi:hypothetical protein